MRGLVQIEDAERPSPLGVNHSVKALAPAPTSGVVADATGDAAAKAEVVAARTLGEVAAATVVAVVAAGTTVGP